MQDYYVFIYNNILISYYFIMLIDVQVKKMFSCFLCKRQYHQVRTSGLIYVSMGTT